MAEYPGAARAAVSPNRSPRQGRVQLFIVHHYAGTQGPESAWKRFNAPNDRSVSPNYQVNADGSVFEVVPPDRFRAWTTGTIDHQAVTCETQNTTGAPSWGISRESHEAIAHLIAWASKRYGFPIQRGAVADGNRVTVPGVVGHRETPAGRQTSTACPGPSMDLDWLVKRAQQIAGSPASGGSAPFDPFQEDTEMIKISAPGRGDALVGPGYFHSLAPSDAREAGEISTKVITTTPEKFDVWRRICTQGNPDYRPPVKVIATDVWGHQIGQPGPGSAAAFLDQTRNLALAILDRVGAVDVDEKALAVELAPALGSILSDNVGTLTDATIDALAARLLDEQAKRLAS